MLAPNENQRNSFPRSPLNFAFQCEPVRISPGQTVVTAMPCFASSALKVEESPTSANFPTQYELKCGTGIFPPIEEIFTILPPPCAFMTGMAARIISSGAITCSEMERSKSLTGQGFERADNDLPGIVDQNVESSVIARDLFNKRWNLVCIE